MKVYISVDMEGIAGVVHNDHTIRGAMDYEIAREYMTNEANAAIAGALDAGATEIVVNDSHGTMRNIYPHLLRKEAKLISGAPKRLSMMEGISGDYAAAVFIGYHTKASHQGVLNHTYNSRVIQSIKVNGEQMGEFGINALLAGKFNVPVVFVSGCQLTIAEAKEHVPTIGSNEAKRSINRVTAEGVHPEVSCESIRAGVKEALVRRATIEPYRLADDSYTFELCFVNTMCADTAATLPIVEQTSPLTVRFTNDDIVDGFLTLRSLIMMAGTAL